MVSIPNIVVLTGAGLSAESGIPTFRNHGGESWWDVVDADGRPQSYRVDQVCTPDALIRDRALVLGFYDGRRASLETVVPNAAHQALARLDAQWPGRLLVVTQNVDDLHERAGATRLVHMHGALNSALCEGCDARTPWTGPMLGAPPCPGCGQPALRPDVVFFGEMPLGMERIEAAIERCDLFVSIGTSGAVYPAAGFVALAGAAGAATLELNLAPSAGSALFGESRLGKASVLVPAWVDALLAPIGAHAR